MEKIEAGRVEELIRKELGSDWDDDVKMRGKFKAFSGQRSDWEPNFIFWRDLIINLARHLHLFIIRPSQVKNVWFNRGGLTPICLDHVLLEMHKSGDILRSDDLVDPTTGRLSQIFRQVMRVSGLGRSLTPLDFTEDHLIVTTLLKEKAAEVVKVLSDSHWTSSCIITLRKLREICGGSLEAYAVLSHLSDCGKARYLVINRKDVIEGIKVSLSQRAVPNATSQDYNVLHLTWTVEKLQQQLDVIDQRYEMSRSLALASLKSGNKVVALRHTRKIKLASQSREKCSAFLNRVEEVIRVIADAESSKEVSEAMQIGARAIKENKMSIEEVQLCLQELDESIESQKEVEKVLESTSYADIEDEDIEDEFRKLELEVGDDTSQASTSAVAMENSGQENKSSETADLLSNALSSLKLTDVAGKESVAVDSIKVDSIKPMQKTTLKDQRLEAA